MDVHSGSLVPRRGRTVGGVLHSLTMEVTQISAAIAGVAFGLIGAFVALDQLTASARDRRLAKTLGDEDVRRSLTEPQLAITSSIQTSAVARLVARNAMPTGKLLFNGLLVLAATGLAFWASLEPSANWSLIAALAIMHAGIMTVFIGGWRIRKAVREGFEAGQATLTAAEVVLSRVSLIVWGCLGTALLMSPALGMARMVSGLHDGTTLWLLAPALPLVLVGSAAILGPFALPIHWKHPQSYGGQRPKALPARGVARSRARKARRYRVGSREARSN